MLSFFKKLQAIFLFVVYHVYSRQSKTLLISLLPLYTDIKAIRELSMSPYLRSQIQVTVVIMIQDLRKT